MDPNPKMLEYIGEVSLVTDMRVGQPRRRANIYLKLTHDNQLLIIYPDSQLHSIRIESIVRVFRCLTPSPLTIEIKWIDPDNSSIVSTYVEFGSETERESWLQRLLTRLLSRSLDVSCLLDDTKQLGWLETCQIDAMGALVGYVDEDESSNRMKKTKCWLLLAHTLDSQVDKYFRKSLVVVYLDLDRPRFEEHDVRKIVRVLRLIILKVVYFCLIDLIYNFQN